MKRLICFLIGILSLSCATESTVAQETYISNKREISEDRFDDLNGDCGILLLSEHEDLIINSEYKPVIKLDRQREDNLFEYRVIFKTTETRNPKIRINREGEVYHTEITDMIKPDFLTAYRIIEVALPIRMDNQSRGNEFVPDATLVELEFTNNVNDIQDLQILCAPELKAQISSVIKPNDDNINITTVRIPVQAIQQAKAKVTELQTAYDKLFTYLEETQDDDQDKTEEWNRLDQLEEEQKRAEQHLGILTQVEIFGDNTNHLSIDISDMKPKAKRCYAILPLKIVEPSTECEFLMREGKRLFSMRKYKEAKNTFTEAQNSKDCPSGMKFTIEESIEQCDLCIQYALNLNLARRELLRLKGQTSVSQNDVVKYAKGGIEYAQKLSEHNPCAYYIHLIQNLEQQLASLPLQISFTIVEWKRSLEEGNYLSDIEIWSYKGKKALSPSQYASAKRFLKVIEKQPELFEQIGLTDQSGKTEVEFPNRENLPTGFFFFPKADKEIKIFYESMDDFLKQSQGNDYSKRQRRIKMYKK